MQQLKLKKLMDQMTLDEKIYQLLQFDGSIYSEDAAVTGPKTRRFISDDAVRHMGSVYNVFGAERIKKIQENYLKHNRLKIPLLFCGDIIYGYKTILPIPLAFACSWNPELVKQGMRMTARESSAAGIHGVFSPMVDLVRDPRWGRVMESTGEDTYLNCIYAKAEVEGLQGSLSREQVASCVKHFAAYGAPEAGREYNTVDMSERKLRQNYLPAYQSAVKAGCKMVMTSFNTVDGIPATGNEWLMRKILRGEWGFEGVTVSDYAAIWELINHGVAEDGYQAAKLGIRAGVDFDMKSPVYANHLKELIETGEVDESLIDEAVMRILNLKNDLGLFEDPFRGCSLESEKHILHSEAHKKTARDLATESIVLLKNDNQVLPLRRKQKIALIGPYADERSILGLWAFTADREQTVTLKEAMIRKIGEGLTYARGCDILEDNTLLADFGFTGVKSAGEKDEETDLLKVRKAVQDADVIVAALGEHTLQSGEGASRTDLTLSQTQVRLMEELKKWNKPIVCIMFNGRPLVLDHILDKADALLEAWFPGSEGALALSDILFGDLNPSGKLTMSFPRNVGQIPVYYNEFKTGRPAVSSDHSSRFVSKYLDVPNAPQYLFGYGLSYTEFRYGKIKLDKEVLKAGDVLSASIVIKNTGKVKGKEIVQMYIQDVTGSVVRPVKELKGFHKIELNPGESIEIFFYIRDEDLKFFTKDMNYQAEKGKFRLFIGSSSVCTEERCFELI